MSKAKQVALCVTIAGGAVLEEPGERGLTEAAAWSWARTGPDDEESKPRIRVDPSPEGVMVCASFAPENLEAALQRVAHMLRSPACEPRRLERWRGRTLRTLDDQRASTERVVATALMDLLAPEGLAGVHHRATREQIAAIGVARVEKWLRERIAPAPLEIALAGPVNLEECTRLARASFESLPKRDRPGPGTFADKRRAHRPAGRIKQEITAPLPAGTAHVIAGFTGPDLAEIADVRALNIVSEVAKRRLQPLFGKLGATMCVAQLLPARTHPGLGAMLLMTRVPENDATVTDALAALTQILDDLAAQGPKPEEMAEAGTVLAEEAVRRLDDAQYWAACLSISSLQGLEPESIEQAPRAYRTMTAAQVHQTLRRWCIPENRFSLVARPAAKEP